MEIRKNRRFEIGVKRQIVQEVESGSLTASAAARKYGTSPSAILYWQKKFGAGQLTDKPSKRERELERELERYKVLLAEAHAETEFFKKYQREMDRRRKLSTAVITGLNISQYRKDAEK